MASQNNQNMQQTELTNEVEGFEDFTMEELKDAQELEKKINELNKKLEFFQSVSGQKNGGGLPSASETAALMENEEMPAEIQDLQLDELPAIDRRGNVVYSNKIIRENYYNSYPIIRYMHLPYCYNTIKSKIQFWSVMGFGAAYAYNAKLSIESRQGLRGVRMLPLFKTYGFIFGLGVAFSICESIFFEDYCDINSYHYAEDLNRRKIVEEVKRKLKSGKQK